MISSSSIFIFSLFLKRLNFNKRLVKCLSYRPFILDKYFTLHFYSVLLYNFFFIKYSNFFSMFFFKCLSSFFFKDYKVLYFLELIRFKFYLNVFKISSFFCFNRKKVLLLSEFYFRIDCMNFFVFGNYIEYIRRFFFNEYIDCFGSSLVKPILKSRFLDRISLQAQFKRNIFQNQYVFYSKVNILSNSLFKFRSFGNSLFKLKIFDYYIKFFFFYNVRYLFYLIVLFCQCLRFFSMLQSYNLLVGFSSLFNNFIKFRMISIQKLYLFLQLWKTDFSYFSLHLFFANYRNKLNNNFFSNNLKLILGFDFFDFNFLNNKDIVVINYISKLYYFFLDYFFLSSHFKLNLDFITPWQVLEDWYHFDYSLLPNDQYSLNNFYLWLDFCKYNLDYYFWVLFTKPLFLNQLPEFNYFFYNKVVIYNNKVSFFSIIFYDLLFIYCSRYIILSIFQVRYIHFLDYMIEFIIRILFVSSFKKEFSLNSFFPRLKQYRYFSYSFFYYYKYLNYYLYYKRRNYL